MKRESATAETGSRSPSELIDERIAELDDWRGRTLSRVRALIRQADPEVIEEWKWRGVPVWEHAGILCTGEVYKSHVKLTFAKGASLEDPAGLFNASLDGNTRRAIDLHEGETIDETAFRSLIRAAVELNTSRGAGKKPAGDKARTTAAGKAKRAAPGKWKAPEKVVLLSGGNPQIPKGDGDEPVQAYIAAMPGWKSEVGRRIDTIIERTLPRVRKAVKWNSPFYGVEGKGFFLSYHCLTRYVKVAFFQGASLQPPPPGTSKHEEVRYLDIYEGEAIDEERFTSWVRQAAELPGWEP